MEDDTHREQVHDSGHCTDEREEEIDANRAGSELLEPEARVDEQSPDYDAGQPRDDVSYLEPGIVPIHKAGPIAILQPNKLHNSRRESSEASEEALHVDDELIPVHTQARARCLCKLLLVERSKDWSPCELWPWLGNWVGSGCLGDCASHCQVAAALGTELCVINHLGAALWTEHFILL